MNSYLPAAGERAASRLALRPGTAANRDVAVWKTKVRKGGQLVSCTMAVRARVVALSQRMLADSESHWCVLQGCGGGELGVTKHLALFVLHGWEAQAAENM